MLRAAQFAARFEFRAHRRHRRRDDGIGAARRNGFRASASTTSSRSSSAKRENPRSASRLLRTDRRARARCGPRFVEGVGVDQNEWHAYDVYRHNLETLDAAPAGDCHAAACRAAARRRQTAHERRTALLSSRACRRRHERRDAGAFAVFRATRSPRSSIWCATHVRRRSGAAAEARFAASSTASAPTISRGSSRCATPISSAAACRNAPTRTSASKRGSPRSLAERPPFTVRDLASGGDDVIALLVERGRAPAGFRGDAARRRDLGRALRRGRR